MSYREHWKQEEEATEEVKQHNLRKIKFDPTINLGHILSFIGILTLGIGVYTSIDKRVLILETSEARQELRDLNQDADRARISTESKEAFVDIKHGVERLSDKLDQQTQVQVQAQSEVQRDTAKKYKQH